MADIRPFRAVRPKKEIAACTASRSFEEIQDMINSGDLYQYHAPGYYIYELKSEDRIQTGIVACVSIDDYLKQLIKNHEDIIDEREDEKVCRIDDCNIQTEAVIMAYHDQGYIEKLISLQKENAPTYSFETPNGVQHTVWSVNDFSKVKNFMDALNGTSDIYVVSGHPAAASAVETGLKRRAQKPDYDGTEEFNYFMCFLIPYTEVKEGGAWVEPKIHKCLLNHAI